MAFKVSSFSLFLIVVAKSPIAENARSASTEVGLIVKRDDKFFLNSPVPFCSLKQLHLFVDSLRSNTQVFFNLLSGFSKQYPLSLTMTHFSKRYFYL